MPDHALENANRRRDELAAKINRAQQEIEEWRRELTRVEAFITAWHEFATPEQVAAEAAESAAYPIRSDVPLPPKKQKPRNNSKKEEVAAEVRRIIEEAGRPVSRSDLYNVLVERGFKIEGVDPDMVLSTMLWRAGKDAGVIRLSKGGYWLLERDWPAARYLPNLQKQLEDKGYFKNLLGEEDAGDNQSADGETDKDVFG